jgi:dipeptidyl aminopeptidase/acylaminoacyl peptidase
MLAKRNVVWFFALSMIAVSISKAERSEFFSMPGSVLLFSGSEANLKLISPDHSESLDIPPGPANRPLAVASLGPGGRVVSWGFPVAKDAAKRWKVRCAVGVYSTSDQKWRTYGDFSQIHATAISGDGSTVAFIADEADSDTRGLLLLDVGNGQITEVAKTVAVTISWSPDGRDLVLGTPGGDIPPQIKIFDINSRSTRELAEGNWPSWSPSGDWIAYFDHSNEKVHLVHPDGTGNRILKNVGDSLLAYRTFGGEPVWSPDEKKLLLNEYKDEGNFIGVLLLDIDTGHMTRLSKDGANVLAWVAQKK